ncbi:MAG: endolytic transglycosylase MltG [Actinomycetota bacterium]|nr:endolytic transglycosylase MltG [Actinomycetota bacterium]
MRNKIFTIIILMLALIIFTSCSLVAVQKEPEIEKGMPIEIEIKEGMNLTQISQLLQDEGVVENGFVFRLYVQQQQKETALLPGTYTLITGSEMEVVLDTITAGPKIVTYKLIIPEGFTLDQIKERVAQLPFIHSSDMEQAMQIGNYDYSFLEGAESLEGFLFPKTYELTADYTAKDIIGLLISQYQLETSSLDYSWAGQNDLTPYQILIIASLIEREAYVAEERELISAVIHNRLEIGMPLGIDATIRYGLDKWDQDLTVSDLQTDSPYNTRLYAGLIPTPICNPGLEAIRAALSPADVDYLYFVVTDEEKHTHSFSTTLDQHEQNINNSP